MKRTFMSLVTVLALIVASSTLIAAKPKTVDLHFQANVPAISATSEGMSPILETKKRTLEKYGFDPNTITAHNRSDRGW